MSNLTNKYKEMMDVISRLKDINQTDALDEILRKKIEINKTREKMDKLEEELCDGGGAMFYFFTLGLTNDEMNFCLEKLKSKKNRLSKEISKENNDE